MTMIEKVARALIKQTEADCGYRFPSETNWRYCYKKAKAAIEAMREPTDEMVDAGAYDLDMTVAMQYRKMIDAALKE